MGTGLSSGPAALADGRALAFAHLPRKRVLVWRVHGGAGPPPESSDAISAANAEAMGADHLVREWTFLQARFAAVLAALPGARERVCLFVCLF